MKKIALIVAMIAPFMTACQKETGPKIPGDVAKNLTNTAWELVTDSQKKSDCHELPPLFEFLPNGRASGNLGCNLFNTNYKLEGKKLTFEAFAMTKRMCAPKAMELENRLVKVMADTRYLSNLKGELVFWDERGQLLARYRPEVPGACQ